MPEFPTVAATSISLASLRTLIARTIFAISNEESRYTLNGALLVLKAESMAMVADRRAPAVIRREARRDTRRHQRRKARADSAQGAAGAAEFAGELRSGEGGVLPTMSTRCSSAWAIARFSSRKLTGAIPQL
ncbi:MAG: hypothetical protein WDM87_16820 [Terracidiphilus sp.]